jgi:hypothetical protein
LSLSSGPANGHAKKCGKRAKRLEQLALPQLLIRLMVPKKGARFLPVGSGVTFASETGAHPRLTQSSQYVQRRISSNWRSVTKSL